MSDTENPATPAPPDEDDEGFNLLPILLRFADRVESIEQTTRIRNSVQTEIIRFRAPPARPGSQDG